MIKRQGSPPHPLSGFIQAQINQNFQRPAHIPYPPQATQGHAVAQDRFAGFQHGQGQTPTVTGNQVKVYVPVHDNSVTSPRVDFLLQELQFCLYMLCLLWFENFQTSLICIFLCLRLW